MCEKTRLGPEVSKRGGPLPAGSSLVGALGGKPLAQKKGQKAWPKSGDTKSGTTVWEKWGLKNQCSGFVENGFWKEPSCQCWNPQCSPFPGENIEGGSLKMGKEVRGRKFASVLLLPSKWFLRKSVMCGSEATKLVGKVLKRK